VTPLSAWADISPKGKMVYSVGGLGLMFALEIWAVRIWFVWVRICSLIFDWIFRCDPFVRQGGHFPKGENGLFSRGFGVDVCFGDLGCEDLVCLGEDL